MEQRNRQVERRFSGGVISKWGLAAILALLALPIAPAFAQKDEATERAEREIGSLREQIARREAAMGPDAYSVLDFRKRLADKLRDTGDYAASQAEFRSLLETYERLDGPDSFATMAAANNLGLLLQKLGRYDEALVLIERAAKGFVVVQGPDGEAALSGYHNLGGIYTELGRYEDAESSYKRAVEGRVRVLGEGADPTLLSKAQLGGLYLQLRRYREAEPLLRGDVEAMTRKYGPDHRDTIAATQSLGVLYRNTGELNRAAPLLEQSLEAKRRSLGQDHPDTLGAMTSLGFLYEQQGRFDAAEDLIESTLEGHRAQLGGEHPLTLQAMLNVASLLSGRARYAEAEALHLKALAVRERTLGPDHPDTLDSVNNLGVLYDELGRTGEAEALYRRAIAGREKAFGTDGIDTLQSRDNLANLLAEQGREDEAEAMYLAVYAARERLQGPEAPVTLDSLASLGGFYMGQGRYGEAEAMYLQKLAIDERRFGRDNPETLDDLNRLGVLYFYQGRYAAAEPLYLEALAGYERLYGGDHPQTLLLVSNLASLYDQQERFAEGETFNLRALEGRERVFGVQHPLTLDSMNNLGVLYRNAGRLEEAEPLFLKVLALREEHFGKMHPDTLITVSSLSRLYRLQGRTAEAQAFGLRRLNGVIALYPEFHIERAYGYSVYGNALAMSGNDDAKAGFFLKKAVNVLQGVRGNMKLAESDTQRAFLDLWSETYLDLQQHLIALGRLAEAEQVGRMFKDVEYLAFVRGSESSPGDTLSLTRQEKQWEEQLSQWMNRPNRLAGELAGLRSRAAEGLLTPVEQRQLSELETAYDTAYADFRDTVNGWLAETRTIYDETEQEEARALEIAMAERRQSEIAEIGADVALLQAVALEKELHLFLITPQAFHHVAVPVERAEISDAVFYARKEIDAVRYDARLLGSEERSARLREKLGRLYDLLIGPVESELVDAGTRTLMLNLQGQLRYVPFAALWDGEDWLARRYDLSIYTPAANTRFVKPDSLAQASAFGLTVARPGFSELPGVRDELVSIMGGDGAEGVLQGPPFLLDDAFNRTALETTLADPEPVVHIASHFHVSPGDESNSFLLLGDGSRLSLADISRSSKLRFRGVELLTLSACETALGGEGTGMEIEGLGALAQNKGAGAVVATLWQVSDASTPVFMENFYRELAGQRTSKAGAMRASQLAMIDGKKFADPYFWAPFIVMGNWM